MNAQKINIVEISGILNIVSVNGTWDIKGETVYEFYVFAQDLLGILQSYICPTEQDSSRFYSYSSHRGSVMYYICSSMKIFHKVPVFVITEDRTQKHYRILCIYVHFFERLIFCFSAVPGYHSKHQVVVAPWSYAADQQEQQQTETKETQQQQEEQVDQEENESPPTTKTLDLSRPLPSYADLQDKNDSNTVKRVCMTRLYFSYRSLLYNNEVHFTHTNISRRSYGFNRNKVESRML